LWGILAGGVKILLVRIGFIVTTANLFIANPSKQQGRVSISDFHSIEATPLLFGFGTAKAVILIFLLYRNLHFSYLREQL